MITTVGCLFELLIEPPARTDSEIARLLDLGAVRARLFDLKRRGILTGPFEERQAATWRSWYPTLAGTIEASRRSGLSPARPILLRKSWWDAMWAKNYKNQTSRGDCRLA